jgi:hypothetical protein
MSDEHGYFHPSVGYWQTISKPSDDVLSSYPAGTVSFPLKPGQDYEMQDGRWVHVEPPKPTTIAVLYPVHLWERMTQEEADAVGAVMAQQDFRTRQIFASASSYRSDHELWPLLHQIATQLFGTERAAVILAPSEVIPA